MSKRYRHNAKRASHPAVESPFAICYGRTLVLRGALDDRREGFRVVHRQVGEYFPVEGDAALAEAVHQTAVGGAMLAGTGVDAGDPEAAEGALLVAAVAVGVL